MFTNIYIWLLYFTGIQKLLGRYKLCIDNGSDYVEKRMYAHPSFI